ncbi:MAG: hypothetical protein ABSE86_38495 [Bryobacteraceae bacterium]|jgi:hypothetical protein
MKKLVFTALFLTGIAQLANASPIDCSILMSPNSSVILLTNTCTINPDPGFFISSLTLTAADDYTGLQSGSPVVSYDATLDQSAPVFTSIEYCDVTSGVSGSIPCNSPVFPANTVTGLDLSTYSIHLIDGSNIVTGGTVTGTSIVLTLNYGETLIPPGTVPEPVTIGLMSGFLLILGVLARRKKINEARD